ncbi:hypothetical protein DRQ09_05665 [candidate division KSB1 bacterium]|nr:MAG: hypothetical protein DRQ09_05665 [candidate division KSB1 bacterium]
MKKYFLFIFLSFLTFSRTFGQYRDNLEPVTSFRPAGPRLIHILDVKVIGDKAYCCGYGGVSVFDITNISAPIQLGNYNLNNVANGTFYHRLAINGSIIYVTRRYGGIDIIDFSIESSPYCRGTYGYDDETSYETVFLTDSLLFAAVHNRGVEVIDISDPVNLLHKNFINVENAFAITGKDNYLYVANGKYGIVVVDVSNVLDPVIIKKVKTTSCAQFIDVWEDFIFVAAGASGVDIFDISEENKPVFLKNYPGLGFCPHLIVKNGKVYMAEWDVVEVVDVTDPLNPVSLAKEDTKTQSMGIYAKDDFVFVADWSAVRVYRYYDEPCPDIYPGRRFLSFGDIIPGKVEQLDITISNVGNENLVITDISSNEQSITVSLRILC